MRLIIEQISTAAVGMVVYSLFVMTLVCSGRVRDLGSDSEKGSVE